MSFLTLRDEIREKNYFFSSQISGSNSTFSDSTVLFNCFSIIINIYNCIFCTWAIIVILRVEAPNWNMLLLVIERWRLVSKLSILCTILSLCFSQMIAISTFFSETLAMTSGSAAWSAEKFVSQVVESSLFIESWSFLWSIAEYAFIFSFSVSSSLTRSWSLCT